MRKQRGFTLLEGLIVVAILAVLSAMGVTLYRGLVARASLDQFTNDFANATRMARARAIGDMEPFLVCPSRDGGSCTNSVPDYAAYAAGTGNTGGILVVRRTSSGTNDTVRYIESGARIHVESMAGGSSVGYTKNGQPVGSFRGMKMKVGYYNQFEDDDAVREQVVCINRAGAVVVLPMNDEASCAL